MGFLLQKITARKIGIALLVGVSAPLIAEYIKKQIKKREDAKKPKVEANTDHSFSSWTGDDNFFELEGDTTVNGSKSMHLLPLSSKERMKGYPVFKKYSKFNVSPAKRIKVV
jgi:hypothetical protein